jgi:(p)ppGpp synthase/HD superfamily hydrolase
MEETKKNQMDPESFAGYFERTDANRKNQKKVI